MEKFALTLSLFLTLTFETCSSISIKTFYDSDLETRHIFDENEERTNVNKYCNFFGEFYEERNEKEKLPKCIRFKQTQSLYCHGELENFRNYTNKPKLERIENLVVCYHNTTEFDANLLKYFKNLKHLYIGYSSFDHFAGRIPELRNLTIINIIGTELKAIKGDFFSELPSIRVIDLRSNQLKTIEKIHLNINHDHIRLFLHGNQWNCSQAKINKWLAQHDSKIELPDRKSLMCSDAKFFKRPLLIVMEYKTELTKFCKDEANELRNCTCHVSFLRREEGKSEKFTPVASVNCSSKGFYNFPKKLPPYTNALHLDHNHIGSLDALCFGNSTYLNVHDIYLDYNRITDAMVLDNCAWFEQFRVLSLKGNLLEVIPVKGFFHSFESPHALKLYLSENPWDCSCTFASRLLKLCQKFSTLIVDSRKVRCNNPKNDPELDGKIIMDLTWEEFCKPPSRWNNYDIASIIFSILIVLVLANFLFDYYRYKNYGKLPWIVLNTPFF